MSTSNIILLTDKWPQCEYVLQLHIQSAEDPDAQLKVDLIHLLTQSEHNLPSVFHFQRIHTVLYTDA